MNSIDDIINEELYGLFLKVKDSPRHIAIKFETIFWEVNQIYIKFHKDKHPEEHLDAYANEIISDLGWHYAVDLIMSMEYAMIIMKNMKGKKKCLLLSAIEKKYHHSVYWQTFSQAKLPATHNPRHNKDARVIHLNGCSYDINKDNVYLTLNICNNFSGEIKELNVNSPGNIVGKEIKM